MPRVPTAEPGPGRRGGGAGVRYSPAASTRALTRSALRPSPAPVSAQGPRASRSPREGARAALTALAAVACGGRGPREQQRRPRPGSRRGPWLRARPGATRPAPRALPPRGAAPLEPGRRDRAPRRGPGEEIGRGEAADGRAAAR